MTFKMLIYDCSNRVSQELASLDPDPVWIQSCWIPFV